MTIPLDETLLRAETLFHKFKRKIEILDKKRLSLSLSNQQQGENLQEGLRKRKGKETAESNDNNSHDIGDNDNINDSNNDNNTSSTVNNSNKKVPTVHYSLRELLTRE